LRLLGVADALDLGLLGRRRFGLFDLDLLVSH
jgi:hypothetical protein